MRRRFIGGVGDQTLAHFLSEAILLLNGPAHPNENPKKTCIQAIFDSWDDHE